MFARLADTERASSLSNRLRDRRFQLFVKLTSGFARPLTIIDIGGTASFWHRRGWAGRSDVHITTVNLVPEPQVYENVIPMVGDATDLKDLADSIFDVAFSNSVIEHLFTLSNQASMAREIRRVARAFWLQTPNFWFPIEPHFHLPGWQWLPEHVRVEILRRRTCGSRGKTPDRSMAQQIVREVRLMTRSELAGIFPGCRIEAEKFLGLTKSWIVHNGFEP